MYHKEKAIASIFYNFFQINSKFVHFDKKGTAFYCAVPKNLLLKSGNIFKCHQQTGKLSFPRAFVAVDKILNIVLAV